MLNNYNTIFLFRCTLYVEILKYIVSNMNTISGGFINSKIMTRNIIRIFLEC